jgi:hypothetical protein
MQAAEIFPADTNWRWLRGLTEASSPDPAAWRQASFNDATWTEAAAPFWYGDVQPSPGTELSDMRYSYPCIFLRRHFTVGNPADYAELVFEAACDDGFIAWINGKVAATYNVPDGEPSLATRALGAAPEPVGFEKYVVDRPTDFLTPGDNVIAIQVMNVNQESSDLIFNASLSAVVDDVAPVVTGITPTPGTSERALRSIEIHFSEPVQGVEAADLRINGNGATNVTAFAPEVYVFEFPPAAPGMVQVAWGPDHGITDRASTPNAFVVGPPWTYVVNPNLPVPEVMISEFLADNDNTLNDEDGDSPDWIEIYNPTTKPASLANWYLTDATNNLAKWRFPNVSVPSQGFLVVFASGKNRVDPTRRLHTNFKLDDKAGSYLALVDASLTVVSEFRSYPKQSGDVTFGRDRLSPDVLGYFPTPTPGAPNAGFETQVQFSVKGGTFITNFDLTLSSPYTNATIDYTLNGTIPTNSATVYTGPIAITDTVQVRARAVVPGLMPGELRSESYLKLAATALPFKSDLPVVVFHTFGGRTIPADTKQFAQIFVFEPKNGATTLTNVPDLRTRAGINLRGSSTLGYPKHSLSVEFWDDYDADKDRPLLGMPADSDWVFYAPNNFEPVLIHNPFMHDLSRQIGRYSPRARFVEVYINKNGGPVSQADYFGIYVIEERIKRGANRVAVDKLEPEHVSPPNVTGGYVMKVDRWGPDDVSIWTGGLGVLMVDPNGADFALPQRAPQLQYIQSYFDAAEAALNGPDWKDSVTGYAAYFDVAAAIDDHILNVLAFNVDAYRLSGYLHKPRNGRITFGPLWDFDRTLGSTDGRDATPRLWRSKVPDYGTDFFNADWIYPNPWFGRMFQDIDFWQRWVDRWQELRQDHFALTNLHGLVDERAGQVRKAQPREQAKWGIAPRGGSYQAEVDLMKRWLSNRVDFIDTNFLARPAFSRAAGPITPGATVSLTGPTGANLYYTLDGTDPRQPGGGLSPRASLYAQPLTLSANARLVARSRNLNHKNVNGTSGNPPLTTPWSGPAAATYVVQPPTLAITEIMYHPEPPPPGNTNDVENFAFVELKNTGSSPLNLVGCSFTEGIQYTFTTAGGVTTLAPGGYVVIVKHRAAFQSRHPGVASIAGEYEGSLDNAGERLRLVGPLQEPIADFAFDNQWQHATDGLGFSLVPTDEDLPASAWGNATAWRRSSALGGSPGRTDPPLSYIAPVLVNEVLTHTDLPQVDTVELFNPDTVADADIGGWFLSDDFNEPRKYTFPAGAKVPAGGFLLLDESHFNTGGPTSFSLSALGDEVYLLSGNGTNLTGHVHGFRFGAGANGIPFGRHVDSLGREHFVAQAKPTPGQTNAGPKIGPVVINEIMFQPPPVGAVNNTLEEFVELVNTTADPVPLYDPLAPTNTWRLEGGVSFTFPRRIFPAGERILLVNFDPDRDFGALADFKARYPYPVDIVQVLGPYQGNLNNAGERLALYKPDPPQPAGAPDEGFVPYVLVDEVHYLPSPPWPTGADGTGLSFQRIRPNLFGNDPANWRVAEPTAGLQNGNLDPDRDQDGLPDSWEDDNGLRGDDATGDNGAEGDPDRDSFTNLQEYQAGTEPRNPASNLRLTGITVNDADTTMRFLAVSDRTYTVLVCDDLAAGEWRRLADVPAQPALREVEVRDVAVQEVRFYRVVTSQVP